MDTYTEIMDQLFAARVREAAEEVDPATAERWVTLACELDDEPY